MEWFVRDLKRSTTPNLLGEKTKSKMSNWILATPPLNIWHKKLRDSKFERNVRILRWIAYDMDFTPVGLDSRFKHWLALGITSYCSFLWNWIRLFSTTFRNLIRIFTNACKNNSKRKLISRIYSALQLDRSFSNLYQSKIGARSQHKVIWRLLFTGHSPPPPAQTCGGNSTGKMF